MNRNNSIEKMKSQKFDLLVIGGGATGAGIALDAASRGLSVALVEKNDFAEGTSSRSTKMFHGGVRYLEKAILNFDKQSYELVKEGLYERGLALKNIPHLSKKCQFITPIYTWLDLIKVYIGLKLYDILSGKFSIGKSAFVSKKTIINNFPQINKKNLKGAVTYFDGQFNDARTNLALIKTADKYGAVLANHLEVKSFIKDKGNISGAIIEDKISNKSFNLYADTIINATGPFSDKIRKLSDEQNKELIKVSSGIHIVLDKKFSASIGMMIPKTNDGRTIFILPWQGHTLIGTTDEVVKLEDHPKVQKEDIKYILNHINNYFDVDIKKEDIKAYWSGLRPLVMDESKTNSQEILRTHKIELDKNGLISILGGKWTAYRRMAEETVDFLIKNKNLKTKECQTQNLLIYGAKNYNKNAYKSLMKKYQISENIALHLNRYYSDKANDILDLGLKNNLNERLHNSYAFIKAEVIYACKEEMLVSAIDFVTRRIPIALLDFKATKEILDEIIELMAKELFWNKEKQIKEKSLVLKRLDIAI